MQTLNISITKEQFNFVDQLMKQWGFANRSEFFRALLRALKPQPFSTPIQFASPPVRDIKRVMTAFRRTNKYNEKFLNTLEKGLASSSYFNSDQ